MLCGSLLMAAPTWLREPQVLSTAIAGDPLGTLLLRRTMKIIDTDFHRFTPYLQGLLIKAFYNIPGDRGLKEDVRFFEMSAEDLNLRTN